MRVAPAALAFFLCLVQGCGYTGGQGYDDASPRAAAAGKGAPEALRAVNSPRRGDREAALRLLAERVGNLRREGRRDEAARMEEVIIRRYSIEKEQEVKACIVRICAPAMGRGSSAMVRFLRGRIAAGELPGYAALSLASLAPRGAYADIAPLARHPAPEVRLQAATALTILADPRGYDAVAMVWRGMREAIWPERMDGKSLSEAREELEARARRGFGRDLR